jgi:hypothetical protein
MNNLENLCAMQQNATGDDAKTLAWATGIIREYESALCQIVDCPGVFNGGPVATKMRAIGMSALGIKPSRPTAVVID